MKKQRCVSSDIQEHCQSVYEDDGIDPRQCFRSGLKPEADRKGQQYCGHVAKTLNAAFAGCKNPVLARLFVVKVSPAPTLSRLEVVIDTTQVECSITGDVIRLEIARASQYLRSEIGREIRRKYVSELFFRLAAPDEVLQ